MRTPDAVYWASGALMWTITAAAYLMMRHWRLKLQKATAQLQGSVGDIATDATLADWCRHMSLTVVTVSGAVFSTTFAELQASQAPTFRQWNVPVSVTVWSDQADEELTMEARVAAAIQDEPKGDA